MHPLFVKLVRVASYKSAIGIVHVCKVQICLMRPTLSLIRGFVSLRVNQYFKILNQNFKPLASIYVGSVWKFLNRIFHDVTIEITGKDEKYAFPSPGVSRCFLNMHYLLRDLHVHV